MLSGHPEHDLTEKLYVCQLISIVASLDKMTIPDTAYGSVALEAFKTGLFANNKQLRAKLSVAQKPGIQHSIQCPVFNISWHECVHPAEQR